MRKKELERLLLLLLAPLINRQDLVIGEVDGEGGISC